MIKLNTSVDLSWTGVLVEDRGSLIISLHPLLDAAGTAPHTPL